MRPIRLLPPLLALAASLAIAACGSSTKTSSTTTSASAANCAPGKLALVKSGTLTVGTDKPGYPPYIIDDKPSNGKGFESAVSYAIAKQLGFAPSQVKWIVVPFNSSYAPGPKTFDFDINQISITPQRAKAVDFSSPYYTAPQAVLTYKGSKVANATSLADLKDAKLGVQVGTTSLSAVQDVIKPSQQPAVFNDSNDTVSALKNKSVDAIVVDLPTAIYLRDAELSNAKVVGQFAVPGGDRWGVVLKKGSGLTACVNQALAKLQSSGQLSAITKQWMNSSANAPELS
ncbi:MAG TPA: ABC transporter substrate-binding protein [Solirubrobacteraceae bacterium]|nr:ABC transporter substrate-binding protein [Solirubrobacteraceae bacterium]